MYIFKCPRSIFKYSISIFKYLISIYLPIAAGMTIRHTIKSRIASPTIAT